MSFEAERFSGIEFRSQVRAEGDTRFESSPIWKSAHITHHRVVAITTRRGFRMEEKKEGRHFAPSPEFNFAAKWLLHTAPVEKKEIKWAPPYSLIPVLILHQPYIHQQSKSLCI